MQEWMETLPEEMQSNETLNRYKTVEDLANAFVEQRTTISQSIRVPSAEASEDAMDTFVKDLMTKAPNVMLKPDLGSPEQSEAFYRSLGVPENGEDYTNPDDLEIPEHLESDMREAAVQLNLTNQQYQAFAKRLTEQVAEQTSKAKESFDGAFAKLRDEWGAAFDKNMAAAKKIYDENTASDMKFDQLNAEGVRTFFALSKQLLGEGKQIDDQPGAAVTVMTPAEASNRINEILNNKEHPYWNPAAEGHAQAQKTFMELQAYKMGMQPPEDGFKPFNQLHGE